MAVGWRVIATVVNVVGGTGIILHRLKCCRRKVEDDGEKEKGDEISEDMYTIMKSHTRESLREQLRIRGLRVSGVKDDLIRRLLTEVPNQKKPTKAQLESIAKDETRLGVSAEPKTFKSIATADHRIQEQQKRREVVILT